MKKNIRHVHVQTLCGSCEATETDLIKKGVGSKQWDHKSDFKLLFTCYQPIM